MNKIGDLSMIRSGRLLTAVVLSLVLGGAYAKPTETTEIETAAIDPGAEETAAMSAHAALVRFLLQPVEDPNELRGYRVAILAADGVDGFDLEVPRLFLAERGATVNVIVPRSRQILLATGSGAVIKAKTQIAVLQPSGEEDTASFDRFVDQVRPDEYDVIYLPGYLGDGSGLTEPSSIAFLKAAARAGRPIFAAGNSPGALSKAGLLDRTAYASRDAYGMPALIDTLIATLLTKPAAQ
ncbi:MAG TPA: DJ-1/PfpI family protein [Burkholderiales bacterium]|nr:DJ-1/PfpI family protein [Burkholderiales bacterium]